METEQRFIAGVPRPRSRQSDTEFPALRAALKQAEYPAPRQDPILTRVVATQPEATYQSAHALLLTRDGELAQSVAMISVGAGVELHQVHTATEQGEYPGSVVLVGHDCVGEISARFAGRKVVLVGNVAHQDVLWRAAAATPGARVAVLPQGAAWLGEYLGAVGLNVGTARVSLLAGACGGAGTSSLAALLAAHHALAGERTLLVDADRQSTGLWQMVRAKAPDGIGWEDLQQSRGALAPGQLAEILPLAQGSAVLSWVREPGCFIPNEALLMGVLTAARRIYEHIIIDAGRLPGLLPGMLSISDERLLVMPIRCALNPSLGPGPLGDWSVVFTGKLASGVDTRALAAKHSMALGGYLPFLRSIERSAAEGRLMSVLARSTLRKRIASIQTGTQGAHQWAA